MTEDAFERFLRWEQASRESIDFKTIYVDMTSDLIAGLLLSQIVYWRLPDKKRKAKTKLRIERDGHVWLAKGYGDWWEEIRITEKQARRALEILEVRGLVSKAIYKFAGAPTTHIRINEEAFSDAWEAALNERDRVNQADLPQRADGFALEGRSDLPQGAEPRNCPGGQIHNIDHSSETTRTQTTTAADAADSQIRINLSLLSDMGITDPTGSRLARIPGVDADLLRGWQKWLESPGAAKFNKPVGFAISQIGQVIKAPEDEREKRRAEYRRMAAYYRKPIADAQ